MRKLIYLLLCYFTLSSCAIVNKHSGDPQLLLDIYRQHLGAANACWENLPNSQKDTGVISVEWTVNDKGETINPHIASQTIYNVTLEKCLLNHLKSLKFAPTPLWSTSTASFEHHFKITRSE